MVNGRDDLDVCFNDKQYATCCCCAIDGELLRYNGAGDL